MKTKISEAILLSDALSWMTEEPRIAAIIDFIDDLVPWDEAVACRSADGPPLAGFPEATAAIALQMLRRLGAGTDLSTAAFELGVGRKVDRPFKNKSRRQASAAAIDGYIRPGLKYIARMFDDLHAGVQLDEQIRLRAVRIVKDDFREYFRHTSTQIAEAEKMLAASTGPATVDRVIARCRGMLLTFVAELRAGLDPPHYLLQRPEGELPVVRLTRFRFVEVNERIVSAMWTYAHCGFHRRPNTWRDAQRFYTWATLSMAEIWQVVEPPPGAVRRADWVRWLD